METSYGESDNICSLCGYSTENLCSLPPAEQVFFLRSILQLPYQRVMGLEGEGVAVRTCGGCRRLVGEAFMLEEEAHVLHLQIQGVRERVQKVLWKKGSLGLRAEAEDLKALVDRGAPKRKRNSSKQQAQPSRSTPNTRSKGIPPHPQNYEPDEGTSNWSPGHNDEESDTETFEDLVIKAEPLDLDVSGDQPFEDSILPDLKHENQEEEDYNHSNSEQELDSTSTTSPKSEIPKKKAKFSKKVEYRCRFGGCQKTYLAWACLRKHEQTFHGDGNLRCSMPTCGERFYDYASLREHQSRCALKPVVCTWKGCDKRFQSSKFLHAHISSAHKKKGKCKPINPFKCSVTGCLSAFPDTARLAIHENRCRFKHETLLSLNKEKEEMIVEDM